MYLQTHRQVYLVGIGAIFKNKVHFLRQNFNLDKQALTNFTTNVVKRTLRKPLLFFRFLKLQKMSAAAQFDSCFKWLKMQCPVLVCIICIQNNIQSPIFISFICFSIFWHQFRLEEQMRKVWTVELCRMFLQHGIFELFFNLLLILTSIKFSFLAI